MAYGTYLILLFYLVGLADGDRFFLSSLTVNLSMQTMANDNYTTLLFILGILLDIYAMQAMQFT